MCGSSVMSPDLVLQSVDVDEEEWRWSRTPRLLRELVASMDASDLRRLVRFITGSPCLPHGGLGQSPANPKMRFNRRPASSRLPQAHTCFNTCDLPDYNKPEVLREKLLAAIRGMEEGIGLA